MSEPACGAKGFDTAPAIDDNVKKGARQGRNRAPGEDGNRWANMSC